MYEIYCCCKRAIQRNKLIYQKELNRSQKKYIPLQETIKTVTMIGFLCCPCFWLVSIYSLQNLSFKYRDLTIFGINKAV